MDTPYGPWSFGMVLMVAGIFVHVFRGIGVFGLRRATLKEKDRQENVRSLAKINYPFTLSGAGCNS
jgi:hypothetical protein